MLEEFMTQAFWVGLAKIIGVNIILSGDNAVVIALAARSLPPKQQNLAIFWGAGAAIVLRIILTLFAVALLSLPWLKLVGSVLLFWIGIKLLVPEDDGDDRQHDPQHHGRARAPEDRLLLLRLGKRTRGERDHHRVVAGQDDIDPDDHPEADPELGGREHLNHGARF